MNSRGTGIMSTHVTLSDRAAWQIATILKNEPDGAMLRVSVSGGGCSGFQYGFDIDSTFQDDDLKIEKDGAIVLIDALSIGFMEGAEIDYVDDLIGASFQINNPNATASCGCGTSFAI
jgi:iron-sulfur cluster assembly accessory protein